MNKNQIKSDTARKFEIGDVFYYFGKNLKIEVVGMEKLMYPECRVLEVGPQSKFGVGDIVRLDSRALWKKR